MIDLICRGLVIALLTLGPPSLSSVACGQEGGPITEEEAKEELNELGEGLKAAVASGAMSREDARALWKAASVAHKLEFGDAKSDGVGNLGKEPKEQAENPDHNPRTRISRLVPPWPGQLKELLHPQFMIRDARLIGDRLDLHDEQVSIIEVVLQTYESTWEETTETLTDAMERYRRRGDRQTLQTAVEHFDQELEFDEVDTATAARDMAVRRVDRRESRRDKDDRLAEEERAEAIDRNAREIHEWLTPRLQNMTDRVTEVRNRIQHRLMIIEDAGDVTTPSDILALAENLRQQRGVLEEEVLEMIGLTVILEDAPESSRRLMEELNRLRIDDGYRFGRLGGESIRPWGVLADTFRGEKSPEDAEAIARHLSEDLADLVRRRNALSIDREVEGWRFLVRRDELIREQGGHRAVSREQWLEALDDYVTAWHDQIGASAAFRDALLELVDETTSSLVASDHPLAGRYHRNAMRTGFALEMKPRWVELAIDQAMDLEDLDEEDRAALIEWSLQVRERLTDIRQDAINRRIQRDPELALTDVLAFWGKDVDRSKAYTQDDWWGFANDRHEDLAQRTWKRLESILSEEQLALITEPPGAKAAWSKGKD